MPEPSITRSDDLRILPIHTHKDSILERLEQHPVLVIAGETGSGKTTQLPQFCLEAGRKRIACTQPRRIAAVSVAQRIAWEIGEEPGDTVGYQIRFSETLSSETRIRLMTDGILLAQTAHDPLLLQYDTIIVDEAHERSLNIDFILGILRRILTKRNDLKVIITSATIDTGKFSKAFSGAPVIKVSGRSYPVEVRYQADPEADPGDSYVERAVAAAENLYRETSSGDILVFMPTEQDIRDSCELLSAAGLSKTLILPLYARMNAADQYLVFKTTPERKIVVATNIAETSITIPGIRFVIDTGLARISSYSPVSRTNALPIVPISRSSADQRKGRCGRVSDGLCIRLYSEQDYMARELYTLPEILRSNLAEIILRMIALKVEDILHFPFIDPPRKQAIAEGITELRELGAIKKPARRKGRKSAWQLTNSGRFMSRLPLEPRISRILLESRQHQVLREMTVIAAALSLQDPKERPIDKQSQADIAHARFADTESDLVSLLNIWDAYHLFWREQKSKSKMRKWCETNYISYRRMREWRDIHLQLTSLLKEQGSSLKPSSLSRKKNPAGHSPFQTALHSSFLSGYLSNIAARKHQQQYIGAKQRESMIFPGSALFRNPPQWICAAELVKTSRLFSRTVVKIEPEWVLRIAPEKNYSYRSAAWSFERQEVTALRQTRVHSLLVEADKEVAYGPVHPQKASMIFCETALVLHAEQYAPDFNFLQHNQKQIAGILKLEERLRRKDIFTGHESLIQWYAERMEGIYSLHGLKKRIQEHGEQDLLLQPGDFMFYTPDEEELKLFPEYISINQSRYPLLYCFDPDEARDGVTVLIQEKDLQQLQDGNPDWIVPGLLQQKILLLLKALPRDYRRRLSPVSRTSEYLFQQIPEQSEESLKTLLSKLILKEFDLVISEELWNEEVLPNYLRLNFELQSATGSTVQVSKTTSDLKKTGPSLELAHELELLKQEWERSDLNKWDFERLPEFLKAASGVHFYPGLSMNAGSIGIRVFRNRDRARESHRRAAAWLAARELKSVLQVIKKDLELEKSEAGKALYFGGLKTLNQNLHSCMIEEVLACDVRSKEEFQIFLKEIRETMYKRMQEILEKSRSLIQSYFETRSTILQLAENSINAGNNSSYIEKRLMDLRELIPEDFPLSKPYESYGDILRHAQCLLIRTRKALLHPVKDQEKEALVAPYIQWYNTHAGKEEENRIHSESEKLLEEYARALEEYKIQIFAQEMKTNIKVSAKRLDERIKLIEECLQKEGRS